MAEYAKNTKVPVSRSKTELEAIFQRWGVDGFMIAWEGDINIVAFKHKGLQARIPVPQPQRTKFPSETAYEQAIRQRWRAMILFVKSTLEAVDAGIISFEQSVGSNTRTTLSQPGWQLALVSIWSDGLSSAIHLPKRAVQLRSEA